MGLLLKIVVHPANEQDRASAPDFLLGAKQRHPQLSLIYADQGYTGRSLRDWTQQRLGCSLQIVSRPRRWVRCPAEEEPPGMPSMSILPRRWVVERTFAWICRNRRLAKDYEGLPQTGEALVYAAMSRLMLKRLAV